MVIIFFRLCGASANRRCGNSARQKKLLAQTPRRRQLLHFRPRRAPHVGVSSRRDEAQRHHRSRTGASARRGLCGSRYERYPSRLTRLVLRPIAGTIENKRKVPPPSFRDSEIRHVVGGAIDRPVQKSRSITSTMIDKHHSILDRDVLVASRTTALTQPHRRHP